MKSPFIPEIARAVAKALENTADHTIEQLSKLIVPSQDLARADYALPCFGFAKQFKQAPQKVAAELANKIDLPTGIQRVEAVGGYLNFFVDRIEFSKQVIANLATQRLPSQIGQTRPLLIEYSSPNIAKPFHVAHLRTTFIGAALDRIHRFVGQHVISINHLGDWGTQFGFVYAGCQLWGKPASPSVDQLVEVYVRATNLRAAQEKSDLSAIDQTDRDKPDVNKIAREYFQRLEAGDQEAVQFWKWCLDLSIDYLKSIYDRLGVKFDHYTGESFYRPMLARVEQMIRESGILQDSRGALGVDLGKELGFVRIFAEDGRSLYITRDIAAAIYRYETYQPQKIVYVVGAPQSLHFKQLIGVLQRMQHPVAELIEHVAFGNVPGMSTRAGTTISLSEYLSEAQSRALAAYRGEVQKRPEGVDENSVAQAVAIGATYFYFLSHSNIKDFQFRWEEALNFQGDSGPYVQYTVARLRSIAERANQAGIKPQHAANLLSENSAHELVTSLAKFRESLEQSRAESEPQVLAHYILDLARAVGRAYRELRVLDEAADLAAARLALLEECRQMLECGMHLLGIPVIAKM